MKTFIIVISAIIGYCIGSLNFAVIIGKLFYKKDVRNIGSKSAGATNTLRSLGKKAAIAVTIGDFLKGVAAYLLCELIGKYYGIGEYTSVVGGFSAIIGHDFPFYFRFKGGKGVLTSLALSFMIDVRGGIIALSFAIIIMILTKYVSLGSILGCALNAVVIWFLIPGQYFRCIVVVLAVVIAIIKHKSNIIRLVKGEETKIGQKAE